MSTETVMIDSMGQPVPIRYVSKYDRTRDAGVRRIRANWMKARKVLERVMTESLAELDKIAKARGAAGIEESEKGNFQVSSFDGLITVSINVRYDIILDERVIQARELMLEYARDIAAKLGEEDAQGLLALVEEAFKANKAGALSVARVISLMRRDIKNEKWQRARALLSESMETRRGKSYLRVDARPDRQHDPVAVRLDIADCWPSVEEGV